MVTRNNTFKSEMSSQNTKQGVMLKYEETAGHCFVTQHLVARYQSTINCVYQIQQSADSGRIATLTALHLSQPSLPRLISKQSLIEEMPWSIV